jgi:hypothetical protein
MHSFLPVDGFVRCQAQAYFLIADVSDRIERYGWT